jgi:alkylation response protein AidB-like acyl-CoA dehydrogenase
MATLTVVEPDDQLVQETLEVLVREELAEFAASLQTARALWRQYREMVEAPEFPAHLQAAFLETYGFEPDDDRDAGSPDPAIVRAIELPKAREAAEAVLIARAWAGSGQPSLIA